MGAGCHVSKPSPFPTLTQQRDQWGCSSLPKRTDRIQGVQVPSRGKLLPYSTKYSYCTVHSLHFLKSTKSVGPFVPELWSNTLSHCIVEIREKGVEFGLESEAGYGPEPRHHTIGLL